MILNKNLNAYFYQGIYFVIFYSITFMFLKAYVLELGASNFYIGFLGAIPFLAILLSEIPGAFLGNKYDHKYLTFFFMLTNRFFWIGVILAYFVFPSKVLLFIAVFYFLSEFFGWLADPPQIEIMGEIIPKKIRGEYFSYRDRAMISAKIITILAAGFFIDNFYSKIQGYNVLFGMGIIAGIISSLYVLRFSLKQKPLHKKYSFKNFLNLEKPFKKFLIYSFWFDFAHMIVSPFFLVYLLKNVGLSLGAYSMVVTIEALTTIATNKRIGFFSDKYGDKKMHLIFIIGAALTPLLYLLFITPSTIWLLIPVSLINGFSWGGYNLTRKNLLLDVTDVEDREIRTAEYRTITAFPMFIAPLLGGIIADKASFFLSGLPLLFVIAFILRISSIFFAINIPETRVKTHKHLVNIVEEFFNFSHFTPYLFFKRKKIK